ncbi:unnamed protein product [Rotaria sordida]|uniref:Mos1 transposase HTH domain-containing protein n=1 Tax=Rotaria sordida TaxID=392033 RepID=A0A818VHW4_9BILA
MHTAVHMGPKFIYDALYSVCDDKAPSHSAVIRWSKWYHEGGKRIKGKPRPSRPVIDMTSENIEGLSLIDDPILQLMKYKSKLG